MIGVIIDTAAFIWDIEDYEQRTHNYYGLIKGISKLLTKLDSERSKIVLRKELRDVMLISFPWSQIPDQFWAFKFQVSTFLSKVDIMPYESILRGIDSEPNLIRDHFDKQVSIEVDYLISHIHLTQQENSVFVSFVYLWNSTNNLRTIKDDISKEHDTILADNNDDLENFYASIHPKFRHNAKHDKTPYNTREYWNVSPNKDAFISRLSCYDGISGDYPQKLLDHAIFADNRYYSYDSVNKTYVVFMSENAGNIYHGFDEYNPDRIPDLVKRHFNIYKY